MSAQIIKLRRGSLEALSTVTASLQKGEVLIATGSSNLGAVTNGKSLLFSVPENGQVQATNRFLVGSSAPSEFVASTYNGMVDGVPYYDSGSGTLFLLSGDGNQAINLIGNIQPFSQSVDSRLISVESSLGSGGSIGSRVDALESSSVLVNQFTSSVDSKFSTLATYTGSVDSKFEAVATVTSSLILSASSFESRFGTLATYTGSVDSKFTEIGVVSGSLIASASEAKTTNDAQDISIANLNSFTQSFSQSVAVDFSASAASVAALSASVASVTGDFSSSVATSFSASEAARVALSQSVSASFSAVAGEQSAQDARLDSLESETGSYAKLDGGNVFTGTQVITGSLFITNDLVVFGSSSLFDVTASRLDIGDNTIVLNTATPAIRFAGIDVIDSGSTGETGSFYWDSLKNNWLYVHPSASGEDYNSALFIAGPKHSGSLGDETGLTAGKIPVAQNEYHIQDSIISQLDGKITIEGGLDVTGEISSSTITGIGNVSAFSQSVDTRVSSIESSLGEGGSIGARVATLETSSANLNAFTSSQESKNSTLATYTASVDGRLSSLETASGSAIGRLNNIESFSSSVNIHIANVNAYTASNDTKNSEQDTRINALAALTASVDSRLVSLETVSGSTIGRLNNLELTSASVNISISNLNSYTASNDVRVDALAALTASVADRLNQLSTDSGSQAARLNSLEAFSGSQLEKDSALATYTGSVEGRFSTLATLTGSIATEQTTQNNRLNSLEGFTSSFAQDFTTFSSSVDGRLDVLEGSGSIQGVGTTNDVTFNKITTTSDVVIGGDLVVQGNTVTLNTSQLVIEDKLITLASGSTQSSTSDGAGFEVAGADANFVYQHSTTAFTSSVALIAPEVTASINLGTAAGNTKRVAFRNNNGNLDLVPTASVAGDLLQWNGTDFVMSNIIDGGSF
jgi:uncharacterized coiled-coil protein SlyX